MAAINFPAMPMLASAAVQTSDDAKTQVSQVTSIFMYDDVLKNAMHNMVKACGKMSCTAMCKHRAANCRA